MVDFLRRSWAVVDLDCIDHNIRSIKEKLKPGCMIMGVVKADAYGHGDKYIADELVRLGVNWFAVSLNLTEAMSLRNQGIYHPILISGTHSSQQSQDPVRRQHHTSCFFSWSTPKNYNSRRSAPASPLPATSRLTPVWDASGLKPSRI